MRLMFWRPNNNLRSYEIPNMPTSEADDDEYFDACSITGQSDTTFYSARAGGSHKTFSTAASFVDATESTAVPEELDDLEAFQTRQGEMSFNDVEIADYKPLLEDREPPLLEEEDFPSVVERTNKCAALHSVPKLVLNFLNSQSRSITAMKEQGSCIAQQSAAVINLSTTTAHNQEVKEVKVLLTMKEDSSLGVKLVTISLPRSDQEDLQEHVQIFCPHPHQQQGQDGLRAIDDPLLKDDSSLIPPYHSLHLLTPLHLSSFPPGDGQQSVSMQKAPRVTDDLMTVDSPDDLMTVDSPDDVVCPQLLISLTISEADVSSAASLQVSNTSEALLIYSIDHDRELDQKNKGRAMQADAAANAAKKVSNLHSGPQGQRSGLLDLNDLLTASLPCMHMTPPAPLIVGYINIQEASAGTLQHQQLSTQVSPRGAAIMASAAASSVARSPLMPGSMSLLPVLPGLNASPNLSPRDDLAAVVAMMAVHEQDDTVIPIDTGMMSDGPAIDQVILDLIDQASSTYHKQPESGFVSMGQPGFHFGWHAASPSPPSAAGESGCEETSAPMAAAAGTGSPPSSGSSHPGLMKAYSTVEGVVRIMLVSPEFSLLTSDEPPRIQQQVHIELDSAAGRPMLRDGLVEPDDIQVEVLDECLPDDMLPPEQCLSPEMSEHDLQDAAAAAAVPPDNANYNEPVHQVGLSTELYDIEEDRKQSVVMQRAQSVRPSHNNHTVFCVGLEAPALCQVVEEQQVHVVLQQEPVQLKEVQQQVDVVLQQEPVQLKEVQQQTLNPPPFAPSESLMFSSGQVCRLLLSTTVHGLFASVTAVEDSVIFHTDTDTSALNTVYAGPPNMAVTVVPQDEQQVDKGEVQDDGGSTTEHTYEAAAMNSAMRKRKAEEAVNPEDEGHWAPPAPHVFKFMLDLELQGAGAEETHHQELGSGGGMAHIHTATQHQSSSVTKAVASADVLNTAQLPQQAPKQASLTAMITAFDASMMNDDESIMKLLNAAGGEEKGREVPPRAGGEVRQPGSQQDVLESTILDVLSSNEKGLHLPSVVHKVSSATVAQVVVVNIPDRQSHHKAAYAAMAAADDMGLQRCTAGGESVVHFEQPAPSDGGGAGYHSRTKRTTSFFKSLFKGCLYPQAQQWEPSLVPPPTS
ncbi:hypothetical protein CEUSTIGMA_g13494.t1 [Chlamydomonas eustigma]|uniref:Uncharacterized protein n=1 Tax=Chlamydomonas eustigma TaxID=1157962 RepID=A0A250XSL5_9CHLO|nr:hypothetical protein CEUSTIGMA_g13494.t1 [Chlamydomonas eustigma]|eukprot:GAX86081.1 hypothetical protein CEUSTIGMA_g13494.t1 [Chlamydomonas eustigma]